MAIPPMSPTPPENTPPQRLYMQLRPFTNPVMPKPRTLKEEPLTTPEDFRNNLEILLQRTKGKTLKKYKPSVLSKFAVGMRHLSWMLKGPSKKEESQKLVDALVGKLEIAIVEELSKAKIEIPKVEALLNTYYDYLHVTENDESAVQTITNLVVSFADRIDFDIKTRWSE